MSVPSMVHRSGGSLIVRSLISGDALYDRDDVDGDDVYADDYAESQRDAPPGNHEEEARVSRKELPDCKVKRNYTCVGCDFFTQNPRVYLYHLRDVHHEKVKIYECPNCLYASKHFQKLLRHTKMVHDDATVAKKAADEEAVDDDSAAAAAPSSQLQQQQQQQQQSVFKCSVCPFTGKASGALAKHEREEHIKTKFFRCSKCTYVTHIKARYTKHVKYHSMPMIKCEMCDFRTPYKWNLDRHCKNHNGHGAFKCSACNFTADIKQSLTVHEMNHHVPPVGQAAGLGVGRRRNKVGASDTTLAEEIGGHAQAQIVKSEPRSPVLQDDDRKPKVKAPSGKFKLDFGADGKDSDFINPDDIIHHVNGKIYFKNKCKYCNFKSAWDSEMAKHEKRAHNIDREDSKPVIKKPSRPVPNLIPIPSQVSPLKKPKFELPDPGEPIMSQKDINDICAKSSNSVLKDFASLFSSEDVFKMTPKVPDLIPAAVYNNNYTSTKSNKSTEDFKQKNASFFDSLREKLELGTLQNGNLTCNICGHESKCLTEHAKHQKSCGKETNKNQSIIPLHNISSSRCQFCRQRCKSSTDLYNHLQTCPEARKAQSSMEPKEEESDTEGELRIDEGQDEPDNKPHPMENKVFVWNDIVVPMDIEVDDSNYEYTDDRIDDNVSLDLSIRTQSPLDSEHSGLGQESVTPNSVQHSPIPSTDKIPTHGNDISIAQHKRVFKCPHCTFWASTASRFHVHIVGHLNKKPFECSLCAYKSNWRWDITKHIKLKSVRDQAHESAKVLMTDETGRRNYTKYNKYLTEIPVTGAQSMDTSGGCGTRPKHHDRNSSPSTSKSDLKANKTSGNSDFNMMLKGNSPLRAPPSMKISDGSFVTEIVDKKRSSNEGKRTQYKCKKCNFKHASRDILLQHVKGHYHQPQLSTPMTQNHGLLSLAPDRPSSSLSGVHNQLDVAQDLSLRGTSPDRDEASVNNINGGKGAGTAPFRCGHCNQVSNWKHVIQRHCRLKHSGDIRVISSKNGQEKIEVEELTDEPDHVDVAQNGAFKCTICPYSTDDSQNYDRHLSGHVPVEDSIHKCLYCKFYVNNLEDLNDHYKLHGITDPDDFRIKLAEKSNAEGDGKKFKCQTCPYDTNSKSQFTYHKQFHKPRGGQYTCTHCSYNVSKRHLLHQHLKVHGINVATHKQNGEVVFFDDLAEDIEEVPNQFNVDLQSLPDIPLVWVSKNGKFSKMFKCRYCPHVNLRKVNIQEHEKMHSVREKNHSGSKPNDVEHKCTECNYICANAGVLSSHSKVHQGLYGTVHRLVDPSRSDEEQIKELSRAVGVQQIDTSQEEEPTDYSVLESDEIDSSSGTGTVLYFCKECPARFLKENEFGIHKRFHGSKLKYKCDHCTYTSREHPHLVTHSKVHTNEYQDRTKVLQNMYVTCSNYSQPKIQSVKLENGEHVYVIDNKSTTDMSTLCSILNKPVKSSQNVPLSGTDLFLQKSEAEQKHAAEMEMSREPSPQRNLDYDITELMRGNPDFIYQPTMKNGRPKEKRYKCHMCPTAFEKREQYKIHLGLHGSKQRYKCDDCDYSVKYYANYVQHVKKHKLNDEAHATLTFRPDDDLEIDEDLEAAREDQQIDALAEPKQDEPVKDDDKKISCCFCPYTSNRKDAVDNHQKRHACVSGNNSTYACEHCDYSVPQSHFLREHKKLHFAGNKTEQVEGFMTCDNMKLVKQDDEVVFEENDSKECNGDVSSKFNNNDGEKRFVNVQTGELVDGMEISDKQSADDCKMEVI
ncbi:unnamed protein product [Phyllotreta striolata]|uniref:C2H2-type domain-containing protein n=1 Tax=Phyllotreta striolata TaxID=444603 RepID=A0A9N9THJ6_PHYSR|nr:unnamed protein product [Phyllotreta striolata]